MKRKTIMKLMALMVASTLMVGSTMSVFAAEKDGIGFNTDDWGNNGGTDGEREDGGHINDGGSSEDMWGWENQDSGSTDSGSASEDTYTEDTGSTESVDTGSNATEATRSESTGNGGNGGSESMQPSNGASGTSASGSSASATGTTATAKKGTIGKTGRVTVPGYETFAQNGSASSGTYKVTRCGDVKAVLQLKDAKGNAAAWESMVLAPMEDGRYALAITTDDAKASYTMDTDKGDATYLVKLGVMAVTVNGTVVRDLAAEAEAAAQAAAEAAAAEAAAAK